MSFETLKKKKKKNFSFIGFSFESKNEFLVM
jgi:hypothetical protein